MTDIHVPHAGHQSKEEGKEHESIQLNITLDPGHYNGKVIKTQVYNIQKSQEVSPFPLQGCKEQKRQYDRHTQNINN